MVWARGGVPRGTREAGRWRPFRGSRFSMARNGCDRNLEKIGGDRKPGGRAPCVRGRRARCAKEKGSRQGVFVRTPGRGNQTGDLVPTRSSRSLGGATPKKGEALRRGNASAGMGDRKTGRRSEGGDDEKEVSGGLAEGREGATPSLQSIRKGCGVRGWEAAQDTGE